MLETIWSQVSHLISFRGTEDIFQTLDDNQVILSTMKASRFVKAFEQQVDQWEQQLSHMLEVIEMILTVQRNWIYLEVQRVILYSIYTISVLTLLHMK